MSLAWPTKDPGETLDYAINWATVLAGDTINTSTFAISDPSLTTTAHTNTSTVATIWLATGTLGSTYKVTNTIVTAGGRTFVESATITIKAN